MPFSQVLPTPPANVAVHGCISKENSASQSCTASTFRRFVTRFEECEEPQQVILHRPSSPAEPDAYAETWRHAPSRSSTQASPRAPAQETDTDLWVQSRGCCYSTFAHASKGGEVDRAMEHKFARHKYHRCRTVFIKMSFFMSCGVLCLVVNALTHRLWVRSAILLLGLTPSYFLMGFSACRRKQEFLSASGTWRERMLVRLLCLQSVLIVLAEWFRQDFDYGLLVMHMGFVHNFTPLSQGAMQVITVACGFLPYALVAMLRYTNPSWKLTIPWAECVIGVEGTPGEQLRQRTGLPLVVLIFEIIVTMRRERSLRVDTLHRARLQRQQRVLSDEKNRIEGLLGSMLPLKIVRALQADEPIEPQLFSDVTVVFVEICDFHQLFHHLQPEDVLEVLNIIYYEFDRLGDDLPSVYKVETVMQVYVAVVGCPEPTNYHADLAARFAIAVQGSMVDLRKRAKHCIRATSRAVTDEVAIGIRVGLHSGPVRAGIISLDSPRYRLIGDTVSTASRIESTCEPGKIQVSSSTMQRLTPGMFLLEDHGEIPVKGKGTMHTAYLIGHNAGYPSRDHSMRTERQHRQIVHSKVTLSTMHQAVNSLDADMPSDGFESEEEPTHDFCGHQCSGGAPPPPSPQAWGARISWWERWSHRQASSASSWWEHFHSMFLLVPESQKAPTKLRELRQAGAEFRKKGLPLQLSEAHKLTTLLLLVVSLLSSLECVSNPTSYWKNLAFRAIGNYSAGLVYLILIGWSSMRRGPAQLLTFLMLLVEGSTVLVCSVQQSHGKASLMLCVTIFSAYAMFYKVCSLLQRLAICASTCGGFLLTRILTCKVTFYMDTINDANFLAIFVFFLACGMRQQEHLELVSHYEQVRVTKRVEEIRDRKAVTYHLLTSMLPPHVVSLVLEGHSPIVEHHSDVTIIFTSIKGFTAYSATVTPQQLFTMLNSMYSAFDEIIANWGLHKVEIIGDGYCISAGCPELALIGDRTDSYEYAMRAVELGLAMQRTLPSVVDATAVQMRVGIHTGAVIAGVVGKKGPRYHLFGPAVSYAEKMESCGIPGRVQISDATHQMLVKGGHSFGFEERAIYLEDHHPSQRIWLVNRSTREMHQIQRKLMSQRRGKRAMTPRSLH